MNADKTMRVLVHVFDAMTGRGLRPDAEDLCDAAWLTGHGFITGVAGEAPDLVKRADPDPDEPDGKRPEPDETGASAPKPVLERRHGVYAIGGETGVPIPAEPVSLPTAEPLGRTLEFDRALRPLRRSRPARFATEMDEEATAEAFAESGTLQIVTRPSRGRWLDISLVIEQSPTMRMWQDTAAAFRDLLWRAASPRSLRVFHLQGGELTTPAGGPVPEAAPCALSGDRLVLLVSDACGPGWETGKITKLLAGWALRRPAAVIQVLPPGMWDRTAFAEMKLSSKARAASTVIAPRRELKPWLAAAALDPEALGSYAAWVTGRAVEGVAGFPVDPADVTVREPTPQGDATPFDPQTMEQREIDETFRLFEGYASPDARRLARHLASAPLLLPVMRLIQRTLVPDAAPAQLAEIFLSGILYRRTPRTTPEPHFNQIEYEFLPGLRERFLDLGGIDASFATVDRVERYVERRFGKGGQFGALVASDAPGATERKAATTPKGLEPFTRVRDFVRKRMGLLPAESSGPGAGDAEVPGDWVYIPGGRFLMGAQKTDPKAPGYDPEADDDEAPVRAVGVRPFWMGKYPVTVAEFREFVEGGRGEPPHEWQAQLEHADRPVVYVTWYAACAYCDWLSRKTGERVRLPTEEEWEFAARGVNGRRYPWGDEKPDPTRANYSETKLMAPSPVGQFPKGNTPEGVSDMAGNVWEWTSSDYDKDRKVVRGASFLDDARRLRAAYRDGRSPDGRSDNFGFRCVREVKFP